MIKTSLAPIARHSHLRASASQKPHPRKLSQKETQNLALFSKQPLQNSADKGDWGELFPPKKQNQNAVSPIARLAPSPTGELHLGNAWSFLIAWLACRIEGGKIYLRMEDIDPQRARKEYADGIIKDLKWLGIDWDIFVDKNDIEHPIIWQSERSALYQKNLNTITPHVYKCYCTRKELRELAGAPQKKSLHFSMPDIGAPYAGTCRNLSKKERAHIEKTKKNFCLRLACPLDHESIHTPIQKYPFNDLVLGIQDFSLTDCGGDFALQRSDHVWAYQLAAVSDDIDMGITQIIRGADILMSTPRQLYLYDLLNAHAPRFAHIPLLLDENGERLAKRHKSLALATIRKLENSPKRLLTYLANLMGFAGSFSTAKEILEHIQLSYLSTATPSFPWEIFQKSTNMRIDHSQGIRTNYTQK